MNKSGVKKGSTEVPIGNTFECCNLVFEVRESPCCGDCFFDYHKVGFGLSCVNMVLPACCSGLRKDGRSVVFVKVGEVQD